MESACKLDLPPVSTLMVRVHEKAAWKWWDFQDRENPAIKVHGHQGACCQLWGDAGLKEVIWLQTIFY